ncbi:bifunctional oligoribonuclease/PAP phosphatase NrnA [bacterium]|nr:bifunctional oligoribonuclease/PAP phosphatase NrnA [bacterium]
MNAKTTTLTDKRRDIFRRIRSRLEAAHKIFVVSHLDPDGDALGSQLALGEYLGKIGKEVYLLRDSEVPEKYAFLPGVENIRRAEELPEDFAVDTAVLLECPSLHRAGSSAKFLTNGVEIINIDHHPDALELGTINWIETEMSSVGEMIFEYLQAVDQPISKEMATALYTAIMTDTGRFRYPSTTRRTMEIGGALIEAGADPRRICDKVYYDMRPSTVALMGRILNTVEFHLDNRVCLLSMSSEMLNETGAGISEAEGVVDFTLYGRGVLAGAFLKEAGESATKVSLRSKNGVNVGEIARQFGGGGHFAAAGCMIEQPMKEAKATLLTLLEKAIDDR